MAASELVEIEDARHTVLEAVVPLASVAVELDGALGRVLDGDVAAEQALPAFDSSAMDGFAVRAADLAGVSGDEPVALRIVGESRAGRPATTAVSGGEAMAISTGAMIPAGADAIVRVEQTRQSNGSVQVLQPVAAGADVRRAGDDVAAGATVMARGTTIGPAELAMLASLGRAQANCARRPRVSVLATGDELLAPGEPARAGAVRDSNSYAVGGLAQRAGAQVVRRATVGDDARRTAAAIAEAVADSDVLVLCGGVSVGMHDHVRPSLQALGATQRFWGLALRPGHPTWFGTLENTLVFGLPGNPVSAMVTFVLLVRPALRALQGATEANERVTAILDGGYHKPAGRTHALRCRVAAREDGWHARPTGPQGSHVLSSMLTADALAIVPSAVTDVPDGARVQIEPLRELGGMLS
ncbi:MAG TPA: gephyrin-like molybdotransferase Glp [Solirubrobacteraceae bacterium]|jgi:molybdopterin molybdotransferase|nr:gephyrin-like molybdotransferase Glp [Solirubrobacteraceae bacterium]